MKKVCVIGSLNVDLQVEVKEFPQKGETIIGKSFEEHFGGKGGNQAVATARLGLEVGMIGKVGDDNYGESYLNQLSKENVNTSLVKKEVGINTGTALIQVDEVGENKIIIVGGANSKFDKNYFELYEDEILAYDIYLLSLEIPTEFVIYIAKKLKENNKFIILDPAPAHNFTHELLQYCDIITPNETEFQHITNLNPNTKENIVEGFRFMKEQGLKTLVFKSGAKGSYYIDDNTFEFVPAYKVNTVDTVAAGDSFNGGLAYSVAKGLDIKQVLKYANAVGALSTTKKGAQGGMPSISEVEKLI